jgi:alpha-beta hydrolase superfamily lysophospholipase
MAEWKRGSIASPTGATLNLYTMAAAGNPRAVIQINHGMAEHADRYRRFAEFLSARGYATFAHDHRGHGYTKAPDAPQGVFAERDGMARVMGDVNAVIGTARAANPGTPVVMFGHSMGTIIALNHAHAHPGRTEGLALWNTSFETPLLLSVLVGLLKAERMFKGSDVPSSLAVKATFEAWNKEFAPNRTAFDWLSRDAAEVDRYVADPLCGFPVSIGMWLDVVESIRASAQDERIAAIPKSLHVYIVAGDRDPSSLKGEAMLNLAARLRAAGLTDVSAKVYPDTRHECLNDINRDAVMADFADWLDQRFPPR